MVVRHISVPRSLHISSLFCINLIAATGKSARLLSGLETSVSLTTTSLSSLRTRGRRCLQSRPCQELAVRRQCHGRCRYPQQITTRLHKLYLSSRPGVMVLMSFQALFNFSIGRLLALARYCTLLLQTRRSSWGLATQPPALA